MTSNLTDHTGYWMRLVSNAVSHEFARKVAGEDVTVAEWVFLRALADDEPMPPSDLATAMGMTKGAISKLADRLEAKGFIVRTANSRDRRGHNLALTTTGRIKVPILAALADANDAAFFGLLDRAEHEALNRILKKLADRRGISSVPID